MALTRKQMEAVIKDGGSVMHEGKILTKVNDLPGEEDLATTDEEKIAAATDLRGRIDDLSTRLAKVEGVPTDAEKVRLMQAHIEQLGADNAALNLRLGDAVAAHNSEVDAHTETKRLAYENISGLTDERDEARAELDKINTQMLALRTEKTSNGTGTPNEGLPVPLGQTATLAVNDDGTGSAELDTASTVSNPTSQGTPLPEGFPKRAELIKVGLTTLEAVDAKTEAELNAVEGITPQTAKAVKGAAKTALGK